jgi:ATP-dependent RNA helicase SUPV3L1/SUV3
MQIDTRAGRSRLVAVLGPTNTGKTHLAMERMLAHETGMIGFPLRLLARENYDRAVAQKGKGRVALITGEEKIAPERARYFLCTVESMPLDRATAFLGVDEIQMCADPDRGHIFTDRLLHARGQAETMFMGAETIRPLVRALVPGVEVLGRPRLSTLAYTGPRGLNRLPARSAVVAFSAADVYAIAEAVRRERGGAAVVLGALSPRTRNAQVAMYQAGEVDYLVATDAIGMGLNMDVDHVAFAATRKFDGRRPRRLSAAELAQIAGRSGRHMNDGTFGTTADIGPLDPETAERIETHRFDPLQHLFWRNRSLAFASLDLLAGSLARPPAEEGLVRAREADDELALAALARDPEIQRLARGPAAVRLLWEVCQIPDFRKVMSEAHARLLARVYGLLMTAADGRLPTDWIAGHVARLDRTDGDIETLTGRIADIRTWTYVAYRGDWLADSGHWQERARAVEDRLSDALHERLTQRFVDRRTAALMSRMKERPELSAEVEASGEVWVEGAPVGRLDGFRFAPAGGRGRGAQRAVVNAAERALSNEVLRRLRRLEADGDDAFAFTPEGTIAWRGAAVARLARRPGGLPLNPAVEPLPGGLLDAARLERVRRRLALWVEAAVAKTLAPLAHALGAGVGGPARGILFQLGEGLGSVPRLRAEGEIRALGRDDRRALRALGVRIGRESVYMPALLKPKALALRALLWAAAHGRRAPLPPAGRVVAPAAADAPAGFYEAVGYRPLGAFVVRVDMLERIAAKAFALANRGPFAADAELMNLAGLGPKAIGELLAGLGYRAREVNGEVRYAAPRRRKAPPRGRRRAAPPSPAFAKLRDLALS